MFFTTQRLTLFVISIALFMDTLDSNVLNTAVPVMSHAFDVNPIDLKIALISYLLSIAIFIPTSGWTADKYGAKPIFIGALGFFTVSSFFCGYAHTLVELIIARFAQGIGGAFMISLGRLIIARTFQRHEFVRMMSFVIMIVSLGVMVGPYVGGVIVDYLSWHWIFWVNIPIGFFVMILAIYYLKDTTIKSPRPFDFIGFVLFGGGLSLLCFSLSEMSESHFNARIVFLQIVIAVLMVILYVIYARRHTHPLIQLHYFSIPTFRVSVLGNIFSRLGFGGIPFLFPLFQQVSLGFNPQLSGILLLPIALGIIVAKLTSLRVLRKLGYRNFLLMNTVLVSGALLLFQIINLQTPPYVIALLTFVYGIFISMQYTGMNSLALADIPKEKLSASTSITSTVQMLAQSFGVAAGAILLEIFGSGIQHALSVAVFHHVFFALSMITLASGFIFLTLTKESGQQMLMRTEEKI